MVMRYVTTDNSGWLRAKLEPSGTIVPLPQYLKVTFSERRDKRDYFKIKEGVYKGKNASVFCSTKDLAPTVFHKAPTKKQRMRIIQRDGYRCKVCGRSPHNNVDVTLHVHHIRPWAERGVTDDENLITLCHTCHEGLDPHCDLNLFGLLSESGGLIDIEGSRKEFFESLKRYREESFKRARDAST